MKKPEPGQVEERRAPDAVVLVEAGKRLRGIVPYSVESRDLGGWREVIEPGALNTAVFDDLVATVDHAGIPIGRYPSTLQLEDGDDGLRWAVDLPESRSDVREAVERGDLRAGSWRMVVGRDRWDGNVRHVEEIAELRDVSVVTAPAYPSALTEFRSTDSAEAEEVAPMADMAPQNTTETAVAVEPSEDRAAPVTGGLSVETRAAVTREAPRGLAEELRSAGFPAEHASVPFEVFEDRAVTVTGSVNLINPTRANAAALGADQRYAWPAFQRVNVDAATTAVDVMTQTGRTLPTAASTIRAIDATTAKPEISSTLAVVSTAMKQVAAIQTGVPNVYLEQPAFNTVIESDLRLTINEGLDRLILDAVAGSGFQAPGTDQLLVSIRKAITTVQANGYNPDVLILTPANAEALDVLVSGISGGTNDYLFGPGGFAPGTLFGLNKRISKTIPAPVVADSTALGKLYTSPVSLARFEADGGTTNRSNVRLELNAVFGVERQNAAVRIAAA